MKSLINFIIENFNDAKNGDEFYTQESDITKSLIEIGKLQGIEITDHIIVSDNNYYSFFNEKRNLFI